MPSMFNSIAFVAVVKGLTELACTFTQQNATTIQPWVNTFNIKGYPAEEFVTTKTRTWCSLSLL